MRLLALPRRRTCVEMAVGYAPNVKCDLQIEISPLITTSAPNSCISYVVSVHQLRTLRKFIQLKFIFLTQRILTEFYKQARVLKAFDSYQRPH